VGGPGAHEYVVPKSMPAKHTHGTQVQWTSLSKQTKQAGCSPSIMPVQQDKATGDAPIAGACLAMTAVRCDLSLLLCKVCA